MTDPPRRRDQEAAVFAIPADHLPAVMRASDAFGRSFIQCFTRVKVEGLEHVPADGPLIISANHISNADPPFMAAWLTPALGRPIHWMAKAEALEWPLAGWFMRQNGAFGIRRGAADTEASGWPERPRRRARPRGLPGYPQPDGALQRPRTACAAGAADGRSSCPSASAGDRFGAGRRFWRVG
jgi:1-acyl-sn-glycerol-3-phosphate acyltransferase